MTRTKGIRQMFITYPDVVRGGYTRRPRRRHRALRAAAQRRTTRRPARKGYGGTRRTDPQQTTGLPPLNTGVRCALPRGSATSVRGAQNAPRPGSAPASSVPFGAGRPARPGRPRPARRPTVQTSVAAAGRRLVRLDADRRPVMTPGTRSRRRCAPRPAPSAWRCSWSAALVAGAGCSDARAGRPAADAGGADAVAAASQLGVNFTTLDYRTLRPRLRPRAGRRDRHLQAGVQRRSPPS